MAGSNNYIIKIFGTIIYVTFNQCDTEEVDESILSTKF